MIRAMTQQQFFNFAENLAREAGVETGHHEYFLSHKYRLWRTGSHFGLWDLRGKDVLEIGPFFSYIPFILRENENNVKVLEGDDPAVAPLEPVYNKRGIQMQITDLFGNFGVADLSRHRLPFPDNHFDIVNCWETMEHFNFNPVGFVRELRRVLKPGGKAFVTVPNVAKLDWRLRLLLGKPIGPLVSSYDEFYNYNGGKFLGWHWREYALGEFAELFTKQQFQVRSASHLLTFTHYPQTSTARKLKRIFASAAYTAFPSTGTICAIQAQK